MGVSPLEDAIEWYPENTEMIKLLNGGKEPSVIKKASEQFELTQSVLDNVGTKNEAVEVMNKLGLENDKYSFGMAVLSGDPLRAKLYLKAGWDPNVQSSNDENHYLLTDLAYQGDVQMVDTLLRAGANPDVSDNTGSTALWIAARLGDIEMVRILLEHGANPKKQNNAGWSPIMVARDEGNVQISQLLEVK